TKEKTVNYRHSALIRHHTVNAATSLYELQSPPGNRLETLRGDYSESGRTHFLSKLKHSGRTCRGVTAVKTRMSFSHPTFISTLSNRLRAANPDYLPRILTTHSYLYYG